MYAPTAALVVEVLSPGDETFAKFDFSLAHGVEELWVADPAEHSVRCWARQDDGYRPAERSALLDLRLATVAAQVDWP